MLIVGCYGVGHGPTVVNIEIGRYLNAAITAADWGIVGDWESGCARSGGDTSRLNSRER